MDSFLKILHILCAILDFLKSILCSHVEGLTQNLEQELCGQESYMSLVGADDLFSLVIHAVDIVFVAIVELIHLSDEVVSFISERSQIIF